MSCTNCGQCSKPQCKGEVTQLEDEGRNEKAARLIRSLSFLTPEKLCYATNEEIEKSLLIPLEDLGDSLDLVEATMDLEDEFGIEISDDAAASCKSVQDLLDLVVATLKLKP
jgi:acyl carrier protein